MTQPYLLKSRPSEAEEKYFFQKEAELIARLQERNQAAHERQEIAAETGIADEEILRLLQQLGYSRETVSLLHFVPLVQVAWASGSVTPQEKQTALRLAEWRNIKPGSLAWQQLNEWLEVRPTDEFFLTKLRLIRHILDHEPHTRDRLVQRTNLISLCIRVATASGGFLGMSNKVCEGEQAAINQIVEELTTRNPQGVEALLTATTGSTA